MKHLLLTTIAAVVLAETAFADPIHEAAIHGDLAGVQAELDKGADVNAKDEGGWTALFHAYFHAGLIELLIENGANPNVAFIDFLGRHYTVFDWYDYVARNAMLGQEPKDEIKENANLIRKLGGKKYYELNPPEITIFYNTVNNKVYISVFGIEGSTFDVLHSSNLNDWKVLKTVTIDKQRHASLDPEKPLGSSFYKIRPID